MITLLTGVLLWKFAATPLAWDVFYALIALRIFCLGAGIIIGFFKAMGGDK